MTSKTTTLQRSMLLLALGIVVISCGPVTPGQGTPGGDGAGATVDAPSSDTAVPASTPRPQSTIRITIPGNTNGWLQTGIWLQAGDEFSIQAGGTINIWPNCEETKAGAGFADLDCKEVTQIGPDGTMVFGGAEENYPYSGGGTAALVGRVGDEGETFLTSTGGTFTTAADGFLQFAINDIESMGDNQDAFTAQVTIPYSIPQSIGAAPWVNTGIILQPGDRFSIEAAGRISMWPNCAATKVERGYPDIDCAQTKVTPAGTDLFAPGLEDYPLPGENTMALIGRVGNDPAFVVGEGGDFVAASGGPLFLVTNDTVEWKKDDQGAFSVTITVDGAPDSVQLIIR